MDDYSTMVLDDHPVGYWRLNERSLTDKVIDESGNGHHGDIFGSPTLGVEGAIHGSDNTSITFTNDPPSYVEIPSSPVFNIPDSKHGLTVEVWMRPDTLVFPTEPKTNYIHWLGKGEFAKNSSEHNRMEWAFRFYSEIDPERSNRISAYAWSLQGGLGAGADFQPEHLECGEWLHLVALYENYENPCERKTGVQIYVNGKFVQGPLISRGTLYFNEGYWSVVPQAGEAKLRFGTRSAMAESTRFLSGGIDEVAIYPKLLTPEQIKRHHDVGIGQ